MRRVDDLYLYNFFYEFPLEKSARDDREASDVRANNRGLFVPIAILRAKFANFPKLLCCQRIFILYICLCACYELRFCALHAAVRKKCMCGRFFLLSFFFLHIGCVFWCRNLAHPNCGKYASWYEQRFPTFTASDSPFDLSSCILKSTSQKLAKDPTLSMYVELNINWIYTFKCT